MTRNDVLRRLRYAFDLPDHALRQLAASVGTTIPADALPGFLARADTAGHVPLPDDVLTAILDGLVLDRRGPRDPNAPPVATERLDNNVILRKLRIALNYKEPEMLKTIAMGGLTISPSELSALFRKPGHKHHRAAGDQLLRSFLQGLTLRLRGEADPEAVEPTEATEATEAT